MKVLALAAVVALAACQKVDKRGGRGRAGAVAVAVASRAPQAVEPPGPREVNPAGVSSDAAHTIDRTLSAAQQLQKPKPKPALRKPVKKKFFLRKARAFNGDSDDILDPFR